MDQEIIIQLEIECKKRMCSPEIGVRLNSRTGLSLHFFVSTWEGLKTDLEPGNHVFEITVPKILLYPGSYFLSPWVLRESCPSDDYVENIITITVLGTDITGHSPHFERYARSGCEIYIPSTWRKSNLDVIK